MTALKYIVGGLVDIGLLVGDVDSIIEQQAYSHLYMHRTGHWLGLDVHDVGAYRLGDYHLNLEPGMVLTVEPGIYISDRLAVCLLYTSPSPRDATLSRMPSSA